MRRLLHLAILLALALVIRFVWLEISSRPEVPDPRVPGVVPTSAPAPVDTTPPSAAPPSVGRDAEEPRAAVLEPAAGAPPLDVEASAPRARVFGQVVDSDARPVAGFALVLSSSREVWRAGVDVPALTRGRWTGHGWRTETDDAGRFLFEVPVPTAARVTLRGRDAIHLGILDRSFGPAGGRNEPRLLPGDNDLGTLVVPRAGALAGTVVDAGGAPIAGARVRLHDVFPGGHAVSTETGAEGRYVLGHLPPGPVILAADRTGYLAAVAAEPAEAHVGGTLPGPTLRLERAPTIAGIVVDEAGAPLADVRVWGWPVGGGRDAGATTGTDGRFVVYLPQDEPYSLEVGRDPRFEPWGGRLSGTPFAPGTADVRIALKRAARLTVAVVDAATGEPVERFEVLAASHGARLGTHPGGRVEVAAGPSPEGGPERKLVVVAPGYVPAEVPVAFDVAGVPLQTVRVEPGARVTARAVLGDRPLAGARVTLTPAMLPNVPDAAIDPDDFFGETWHTDVQGEAARQRIDGAGADGRFALDGLAPGTYRLSIEHGAAAPHVVQLAVGPRETVDLGDVELAAGATLRVTLRLAGGESPVGLAYRVDALSAGGREIQRSDGVFEIEGLAAGEHEVHVRADGRRLVEDVVRTFEVLAGEARDVLIDLSAEVPSEVSVRVSANGAPVARAEVALEGVGHPRWSVSLGATDAGGFARGRAPAGRWARAVASKDGLRLGRSAPFESTPGVMPRVELDASVGSLVLQFPSDLALPDEGGFELSLELLDSGAPEDPDWFSLSGTTAKPLYGGFGVTWRTPRVELGRVEAGRYRVVLHTWRLETQQLDEERLVQAPLVPPLLREIEVRRGEVCVVDVPGR